MYEAILWNIAALMAFDTSMCSCPDGQLDFHHVCIKFERERKSLYESESACGNSGGNLAGTTFNLLTELNTNPSFRTLIPNDEDKDYFWARLTYDKSGLLTILLLFAEDLDMGEALDYRQNKWTHKILRASSKKPYLCEFAKPKRKKKNSVAATRRYKPAYHVIAKQPTNIYLLGSPVFDKRVPSLTFCTRSCLNDDSCDTLNFNPSTGVCKGFLKRQTTGHERSPDWEVWEYAIAP